MKLKDYRELKGISRAKFGVLVGVGGIQIWRYETGRSMPKPEIVSAISAATQGAVTADDHHRAVAEAAAQKAVAA